MRPLWSLDRKLLGLAGCLYVLFGLLAFTGFPGIHDEHHHSSGHNLAHVVIGAALLAVSARCGGATRRLVCSFFALGYLVLASWEAFFMGPEAVTLVLGLLEMHGEDYPVHFFTALVFALLALFGRGSERARAEIDQTGKV